MEKNSVACAMQWSIELEKAIRSKNPGRSVEAILQAGQRIDDWSREPEPTMTVYNMFGLVPGEDMLFANTILLRLANAFRDGDKHIRLAVVQAFMVEVKQFRSKKASKGATGILSKARLPNHLELIDRVKYVYDTGDVESRAMALVLLGCWASFAKDNAYTRYLVLTSLVSSHALEVRASLFAASCFCELADDFAAVVLEMLVDMASSPGMTPTIRLAAVRAFSKLGCSHPIAYKAYKTGLKLMLETSEEDILVAMLVSVTKLASRSTLVAAEQIGILLSYMGQDKTLAVQAVALRCLHFFITRGMCYSLDVAPLVQALISLLKTPDLSPAVQQEALQILQKLLLYRLYAVNENEASQLLSTLENVFQSPVLSNSILAIRILADTSIKISEQTKSSSCSISSTPPLLHVTTLIVDRLIFMGNTSDLYQADSEVLQEVSSHLNLLLLLIGNQPTLAIFVLDKISIFLRCIMNIHEIGMHTRRGGTLANEFVEYSEEKGIPITKKLVEYVNKFLVICLENLKVTGVITSELYGRVQLLVKLTHQCTFFDCYTKILYSMLLHSQVIWGCTVNEKDCSSKKNASGFSTELEIPLECAKKILTKGDYWTAYRAGMYGACQGAWETAACVFDQLRTKTQSDLCSHWVRSLAYFANAELLLLPKEGPRLAHCLEISESLKRPLRENLGGISQDMTNCIDIFMEAYKNLCTSRESLESIAAIDTSFCLQRWFVTLRANMLKCVVDLLKVMGLDNAEGKKAKAIPVSCNSLEKVILVSIRLWKLAQELDLMVTSFVGMDRKSSSIVSSLALSCLVLALSAGFAFFIPILSREASNLVGKEHKFSSSLLIHILVQRLWHIDPVVCKNLRLLAEDKKHPKSCFHMQSINQIPSSEVKDITLVCSYAVSRIVCLQNEANKGINHEIRSQVIKGGLDLLLTVIMKLVHVPFRVPKHFFRIRPCLGSELFASDTDTKNLDRIAVSQGSHLSLNICLQLKNVQSRITKLYCLLYCKFSFQIGEGNQEPRQIYVPYQDNETIVEMKERLFEYVNKGAKNTDSNELCKNRGGGVYAYLCIEPNARGQGFSNCLLDVSRFPVGSYEIKWHSSCIDSRGVHWSLLPLNSGPVFTIV